jgi:hypothetical protein
LALKLNFSTQLSGKAKLAQIAKALGYVQTRGSKGEGSIRSLLEAIIAGEVIGMSRRRGQAADAIAQTIEEMAAEGLIICPQPSEVKIRFKPVPIEGEPISEMIIRERRF